MTNSPLTLSEAQAALVVIENALLDERVLSAAEWNQLQEHSASLITWLDASAASSGLLPSSSWPPSSSSEPSIGATSAGPTSETTAAVSAESREAQLFAAGQQPPPLLDTDPEFTRRWSLAWRALRLRISFARQLQQQKLESMRQLAYGASHEINNPLANISTRAQALLTDESDPERRHKLAAIVAQAFRAHEMIANLMLFARPPQLKPHEFHAREWLNALLPELHSHTTPQGTSLHIEFSEPPIDEPEAVAPGDSLVWQGDPVQLGQLLSALVRNAAEAIGVAGDIQVVFRPILEASPPGAWWEWTVIDNGPGLTPMAEQHAFDPFFSGREAGRGLGFGLSKAWVIVQAHRGSIELFSGVEQGVRVVIRLPLGVG